MFGLVYSPQPVELEDRRYARVTRADMRDGIPGLAHDCAMALALRRAYPRSRSVMVGRAAWEVDYSGRHQLRFREGLFVCLYDMTNGAIGRIWPSFRIRLPDEGKTAPVLPRR